MNQIKKEDNYIPLSSLGDVLSPQTITDGFLKLRISQAALEVQQKGIESTSTLSFRGKEYQSRSINDVMRIIPPILSKHGIMYLPKVISHEVRNYEVMTKDFKANTIKPAQYSQFILSMEFRIECSEDNSFLIYGPIISQSDANDTYHTALLIAQRKGIRDFLLNIMGMSAQDPDEDGATVEEAISINREPVRNNYSNNSTDTEKNNKRMWAIYYDFLNKSKDLSNNVEKAFLWNNDYRYKFFDDNNKFLGEESLRNKLQEVISPILSS